MSVRRRDDGPPEEEQRIKIEAELARIEMLFDDARAYAAGPAPSEKNLHFEAMKGLFDGSLKLFVHAHHAKQIEAAAAFCRSYGLRWILVGGRDAWRLAETLRKDSVAVVIESTHALPPRADEAVDLPYKLPFLLKNAGVDFCISVPGSWQVRNLAYQAGTAAAYGLTKEEALEAVTLAPARIAGIDATAGSLAEGKDATLVITGGDLLDMRGSDVERAFLRGRSLDLDNMQKQLFEKYKAKYGLE
jgi:imidazolonepropionase-like amidohydrolase